jgi:hypothetical protein
MFLALATIDIASFAAVVYEKGLADKLADFMVATDNDDACNNGLKIFRMLWDFDASLRNQACFKRLLRAMAKACDKRSDSDLQNDSLDFLKLIYSKGGSQPIMWIAEAGVPQALISLFGSPFS